MTDLSALVTVALAAALRAPVAAPPPVVTTQVSPAVDAAVWPLQPTPEIAARFEPPSTSYGAGHRGVDLVGSAGEDVHAALAGTVSFAGTIAGRGVVVVDHGATRTTYEPVSATVHRGDVVRTGGALGTLQGVGSHCPPRSCLHWGLIRGETYLDPLSLLDAGPIRLLPVEP